VLHSALSSPPDSCDALMRCDVIAAAISVRVTPSFSCYFSSFRLQIFAIFSSASSSEDFCRFSDFVLLLSFFFASQHEARSSSLFCAD